MNYWRKASSQQRNLEGHIRADNSVQIKLKKTYGNMGMKEMKLQYQYK